MGFFDTVKERANVFAADAERAGKVTAAQARLLVLQNDLRKAERDLGHAAAALSEAGVKLHPDLDPPADRVRETRDAVRAKEAEIGALRAAGVPSVATAPATDEAEAAAPAAAEEPPAGKTAAKRAPRKPAAKKAPAKKTPAKKTGGGAKPAAGKPSAKKPAAKKAPAKKPAAGKPPASAE